MDRHDHSMSAPLFACFDVETTGLDASVGRIIEIAVVRVTAGGEVAAEWSTLVDAGTFDLGRTDIHGIVPDFLLGAPTFGEIAGDLVDALAGCVPVAHNAGFDVRFVCSEWERCGLGPLALDAVDTLPLARRLGLRGRLVELAVDLDVALPDAHRALDDTRALAGVLAALLARGAVPPSVPPFSRPLLSPAACDRVHQRPRVAT